MAEKKKPPTLKRDPISILVYIIILMIVYFLLGFFIKIVYYTMLLPPFTAMRVNVFEKNALHFLPRITYDILYWQPILSLMTTIFNHVLLFILIVYVVWKILLMIPLLGPALIAIIPPFRQFEEAGIFGLLDNIVDNVAKILPKSVVRMFRAIFVDMLKFTKDKITDIVMLINPKLEIDESKFDKFIADMKRKDLEGFANNKPTPPKPVNAFLKNTEVSLNQKNLADKYRGMQSVKPDMEMTDRMYATFNNEIKKIQIQLGNTPNHIKMQMATLP